MIESADSKNLSGFMIDHIDKSATITTDYWNSYKALKSILTNLEQILSGEKGGNFPEIHVIMNFKNWLRGMHHQVEDLQEYINEYTYRFNPNSMKENIFDNLLLRKS